MLFTVPLKYIACMIIIMSITYSVAGFIYIENNEISSPINEERTGLSTLPIIGDIIHLMGKVWDAFNFLINVLTFNLPHIPLEVKIVLNCVFIPMLIVFFIGLLPYIFEMINSVKFW